MVNYNNLHEYTKTPRKLPYEALYGVFISYEG